MLSVGTSSIVAASSKVTPFQGEGACQVEAMARWTRMDKLESILSSHLFKAIEASRIRRQEGIMSLTDSVHLHVAYREGKDFKLELCLCPSVDKAIPQTAVKSVQECKNILEEYLFEAVKGSNQRKEKVKMEIQIGTYITVAFLSDS